MPVTTTTSPNADMNNEFAKDKPVRDFILVSADGDQFAINTETLMSHSKVFQFAGEIAPDGGVRKVEFTDKILESTGVIQDFCGIVNDRDSPHKSDKSITTQIMHVAAFALFLQKYQVRGLDNPLFYLLGADICHAKSTTGRPLKLFVTGALLDEPLMCIEAISHQTGSIRGWSAKNSPPRQGISLNPEVMDPAIWDLVPASYQEALKKTAARLRDPSRPVDVFRVFFRYLDQRPGSEMIFYKGRVYGLERPSRTETGNSCSGAERTRG